jgi:GMP reductase
MNPTSLNYKDIHLVPRYSELVSRAQASTSTRIGKWEFKLPVVPANMASCISFEKAEWLSRNGYFYILHRFYDYQTIISWVESSTPESLPFVSLSIGIKGRDYKLLSDFAERKLRLDFVTIDVAHGDHSEVMKMATHLNRVMTSYYPDLFVIGGNIATSGAYIRMANRVDGVKVGIACGASCITYNKTGFASPMVTTLEEVVEARTTRNPEALVIADGGIGCNGDIAKALSLGADMVMAGSLFARCTDSPAQVDPTNPTRKLYFGSASSMNGNKKNIEGRIVSLETNGMTYQEKMEEIKQDLASAISYAGGSCIKDLRESEYRIIK